MAEHLFGQRQPRRHQESRPVNRVETHDILADDMHIGRPEARKFAVAIRKTDARQIGGQRVDPDIHHMPWRTRNRHAPVKTGARDAQILQSAFNEAEHLIPAAFRADEIGIIAVKRQQRLLIFGKPEEPRLLHGPFDRRALGREFLPPFPFDQLFFAIIGLIADRVPALIAVKIEVAACFHCFPKRDARFMMTADRWCA